ncbi:hypothetical protein AC249_AIPGENE18359, partial [Exaiptasia diaphana]
RSWELLRWKPRTGFKRRSFKYRGFNGCVLSRRMVLEVGHRAFGSGRQRRFVGGFRLGVGSGGGLGAPEQGGLETIHQRVNGRDDQKGQAGGDDQTADHGDRHGAADLGTVSQAHRHGQETQGRGGGGHQNRAQAHTAGGDHRFFPGHASPFEGIGVVDHHDRIVDHDAREHDHAEKNHNREVDAQQVQAQKGAQKRQGDREHDHQWVQQRFELRRHDHVHQENREAQGQKQAALAALPLLVLAGQIESHVGGPGQFLELGLDIADRSS